MTKNHKELFRSTAIIVHYTVQGMIFDYNYTNPLIASSLSQFVMQQTLTGKSGHKKKACKCVGMDMRKCLLYRRLVTYVTTLLNTKS